VGFQKTTGGLEVSGKNKKLLREKRDITGKCNGAQTEIRIEKKGQGRLCKRQYEKINHKITVGGENRRQGKLVKKKKNTFESKTRLVSAQKARKVVQKKRRKKRGDS